MGGDREAWKKETCEGMRGEGCRARSVRHPVITGTSNPSPPNRRVRAGLNTRGVHSGETWLERDGTGWRRHWRGVPADVPTSIHYVA